MVYVERRRPGWNVRGARALAAVSLLVFLASGGYALGSKDGEIRDPSSRDLGAFSQGPYGTAPEPSGTWSLAVPTTPKPEVQPAEPSVTGTPRKMTVEEAVAVARDGNLGLVSPRIAAEGKRRADALAWNNFLPTVDVSGTLGRWNVDQSSMILGPVPRWSLSASFSAQLMLNLALFEGVKSLRADYEAGLISYAQAEARLERDVRKSFYNLLLLEENMKLMEEQIEAARRRYEQARANYRAGTAPELSMLQAQVAYENLKPALQEMRIGYQAARDAFAMTLGLPRGTEVQPAGKIEPAYAKLDADAMIASGLSSRLDIQSLVKSLESLQIAETGLKYRLWTPNLILGWNLDPAFSGDPWADDLFDGDRWSQRSGMFRATLSMRLNGLLPFTQDGQQLAELRDQRESLRANLAQALRGAEMEIDGLVRRLEKSRTSHTALELNAGLAERAYRLSEEAYRAGAADLLDVQNAELELRKARLELLKEDYTYVTALLDLEYAVGARFGSLGGSK
ncbi:MAG TPA: TolC family protein [Spirochaetia bacterium]|nr:TolC family protein [Spirochaetales bacterium]HRY80650.1 TolC family protein [Spirochaetia bacterium]HRZ89885.1 TolC family protein [Spirochaetia bacterium]